MAENIKIDDLLDFINKDDDTTKKRKKRNPRKTKKIPHQMKTMLIMKTKKTKIKKKIKKRIKKKNKKMK